MQIAVFGGTGFLGTHLLKELHKRGCRTRLLLTRKGSNLTQVARPPSVASIQTDLNDSARLCQDLAGCNAIIYLSGINREIRPGDFAQVHVRDLQSVIQTAERAGIPKIIYVSFLRARAYPQSNYLQSKWDGENLLRESALDYTILKPGICFGTGDQMVSSIVRGLTLTPAVGFFATVGIRQPTMSPIYAGDIARIMVASAIDGRLARQTNAVVGPDRITMSDAVRRVARVIKKKVIILPAPIPLMFAGAWTLEHLSHNPLITVSQIRMLADGLSEPTAEALPLPDDLLPKTYFTEEQIKLALDKIG